MSADADAISLCRDMISNVLCRGTKSNHQHVLGNECLWAPIIVAMHLIPIEYFPPGEFRNEGFGIMSVAYEHIVEELRHNNVIRQIFYDHLQMESKITMYNTQKVIPKIIGG